MDLKIHKLFMNAVKILKYFGRYAAKIGLKCYSNFLSCCTLKETKIYDASFRLALALKQFVNFEKKLGFKVEGQSSDGASPSAVAGGSAPASEQNATGIKLRFPRFLRRTHSASYSGTEEAPAYALFLRSKPVSPYFNY